MDLSQINKQFFLRYHAALSGKPKSPELISRFVQDEKLIGHILFFEKLFPECEVVIDELVAEGRGFCAASHHRPAQRRDGRHSCHPKTVDAPFALGYRIQNEKIVGFWAITNEMDFFRTTRFGPGTDQCDGYG